MATKAAQRTEEPAEKREEGGDGPLLDTTDAAVKNLVKRGKERGYITYDELNKALPPDNVSSEQIEDTMAVISEMGINLIETEEGEEPSEDLPAEARAYVERIEALVGCEVGLISVSPLREGTIIRPKGRIPSATSRSTAPSTPK